MRKKTTSLLLLAVIFVCTVFAPVCAFGAPSETPESDTIRVVWPELTKLSMVDEDGNYSGYDYEYLQKIAQYTGWKYEFITFESGDINERLTRAMEMVQNGEADIIGSMNKNESTQALYDFPTYSYGTTYKTLIVSESNATFYSINDLMQHPVRVAVYKKAENNKAALRQFCDANRIQLVMIECETEGERRNKVSSGEADAMLSNDLNPIPGMRTVARFAGAQYYFATTKGNTQVVNGLNSAFFDIHTSNPYFETELYRKYFEEEVTRAALSSEETAYVKQAGTLRVLISPTAAPFQYLDENGALKGVTQSILNTVTEQTGLRFEYVFSNNHEEFQRLTSEGGIDLIAGIPYNYRFGERYDTVFTNPFVTASMTLINHQTSLNKPWDQSVLALPYGSFWAQQVDFKRVDFYDSVQDCVDALLAGKADYAHGNIYSIDYYTQDVRKSIVSIPLPGETMGYCVGVTRPADMNLISILNKVVRTIPENETTALLFHNSTQTQPPVTFRSFVEANPAQSVAIVASILLVIILLVVILLYSRVRANRRLALNNQRYLMLSDIANEHLFEYDRKKDILTLSQKCADLLKSERIVTDYSKNAADGFGNLQMLWKLLRVEDGDTEDEIALEMPSGSKHWYSVVKTSVGDDHGARFVIGKLTDIQKERQEKELLLEKSRKDGLTGLYNIGSCKEQVQAYLSQKPEGELCAFLVCDIDYFKEINDTFGHFNGDKVLIGMAGILRSLFSSADVLARLGGDEFIVFMKNVKTSAFVEERCARLCETFKKPFFDESHERLLTMSIGAAMIANGTSTYETLYRRADAALYRVKERGRDGFEVDSE